MRVRKVTSGCGASTTMRAVPSTSPATATATATTVSTAPASMQTTCPLLQLHDEMLAQVLRFLGPRALEAATVASRVLAFSVVPKFPLWKPLFCRQWSAQNFALEGVDTGEALLEISAQTQQLFPRDCSENRMFQLLAHAVKPVPAYADLRATARARPTRSTENNVQALGNPRRNHVRSFAYMGEFLGGDRCVRANVPFPTVFHVAVFAQDRDATDAKPRRVYTIGVVASGYFEITIAPGPSRRAIRMVGSDMVAVGLATSGFTLVDKQPGWDANSIGYHGDDGHLFRRQARGRPFAQPFGVGDTVGCGIRRDPATLQGSVYFTTNGELLPAVGHDEAAGNHTQWYPVVGMDTTAAIQMNFGQAPFTYNGIVDLLLQECDGQTGLFGTQLSWYDLDDSDVESLSSGPPPALSDEDYEDSDYGDDGRMDVDFDVEHNEDYEPIYWFRNMRHGGSDSMGDEDEDYFQYDEWDDRTMNEQDARGDDNDMFAHVNSDDDDPATNVSQSSAGHTALLEGAAAVVDQFWSEMYLSPEDL